MQKIDSLTDFRSNLKSVKFLSSPFSTDELITMVVRIKYGENLLRPHRRHFYQVLANELRVEHWKVSAGYGLFQLIVGMSILLVRPYGMLPVLILLSVFFSAFILANYIIRAKAAGTWK